MAVFPGWDLAQGAVPNYLGALQIWRAWGNTHAAGLFGTAAYAAGSSPLGFLDGAARQYPEPLPYDRMVAATPATAASEQERCEAECYQRYGLTCLPLTRGTPLECACLRACRAGVPPAGSQDVMRQFLLYAAGLALVVVGISAALR